MAFFLSCAREKRSSTKDEGTASAPGNPGALAVHEPIVGAIGLEYEWNVAVPDALRDDASHLIDLTPQALDGIAHDCLFCE